MLVGGEFTKIGGQLIAVTTVLGLGVAFVPVARADPAGDACAALVNARFKLFYAFIPALRVLGS
jgi:hypothetical protein